MAKQKILYCVVWALTVFLWIAAIKSGGTDLLSSNAAAPDSSAIRKPVGGPGDSTVDTMPGLSIPDSAGKSTSIAAKPEDNEKNRITDQPCINVNTANAAELKTLPGIGPKLAERILKKRADTGKFLKGTDLLAVKGIGKIKLSKIESLICF